MPFPILAKSNVEKGYRASQQGIKRRNGQITVMNAPSNNATM